MSIANRFRGPWFVTLLTFAALALPGLARRAQASCMDGANSTCSIDGQAGTRECISGHWGACEPNPPPGPPPLAPAYPTTRTENTITLSWRGVPLTGEQYQLQYQVGATWTPLFGPLASPTTFVHQGLQPDTRYCYRVEATGGYGRRASTPRCRYTTDGTGQEAWRVQIEIHTGSVEDAETDDGVNVVLSDISSGTGVNLTWLDYGEDDFERGDTFRYDLNLDQIQFVSDVTKLRITKTGTDGWCIEDFRLLVNEEVVYEEAFPTLPGRCKWLDGEDGHLPSYEVDHARLRAHPAWQAYDEPQRVHLNADGYPEVIATVTIPRGEAESRVEAMIGHLIHGTQAYWGSKFHRAYVEADPSLSRTNGVSMDLDLEASVDDWFDPELDINFDLRYEAKCSEDGTQAIVEVKTEALEAHVDFDWFTDFLGFILPCGPIATPIAGEPIPNCVTALEDYIAERIEASFQPIAQSQHQQLPAGARCLSGSVVVHRETGPQRADVDLVFRVLAEAEPPAPAPAPGDFAIACTPASLTIPNAGSSTTTCLVTSQSGFSKPVSLGCTGLPSGSACSFSPATVTPPANGSVQSTLNVSVGLTPAGSYNFGVEGVVTTVHRHDANIALTVAGSTVRALTATFDAARQAPSCGGQVGGSCDSATLVRGRGTGGREPHASNTIDGSCRDGENGPVSGRWNAVERIKVSTGDGTTFAPGKGARIDAVVWASGLKSDEAVDFFYAADAVNPSWTLIGTVVPGAAGLQGFSVPYRLPAGGLQAVRVQLRQGADSRERYQGSACTAGTNDDRDDLVFAVKDSQ